MGRLGDVFRNPQAKPHAPDLLILEEYQETTRLICFSLTDKGPAFRHDTNKRRTFLRPAIIGRDFVSMTTLNDDRLRANLFVLSLEGRGKGALPGGESWVQLPERRIGFKVRAHGRYILCQNQDQILVFGSKEK